MSARREDQDKVTAYLRRHLRAEESFAHSYEMDPYTRVAYRRARELYWTLSRVFGSILSKKLSSEGAQAEAQRSLGFALARPLADNPRIFIDATDLLDSGKATGIQRVLRETARNAAEMGLAAPVAVSNGRFIPAAPLPDGGTEIAFRPGDILLLLDAGWNRLDLYPPALQAFRDAGGFVVACIYDLFPIIYPTLYTRGLIVDFQAWISMLLSYSDAAVAISKSSADSFEAFVKGSDSRVREGFRLGWWRLGADIQDDKDLQPSAAVSELAGATPFFLSVGTVEMRKGYPVALEAFEKLWAEGVDANYVIVGRAGWNATAFEERLRYHPQRRRRLFWLDNAEDADLRFLYKNARAVVLPTFAEGFGLPLVEAAQSGAPVIASDIDVFREIGGDGVRYFDVFDSASLAARIRETLGAEKVAPKIDYLTWRESTVELMNMLRSGAYQKRLG